MKALSLTQPWASLVVLGAKRYETRSWPTPYRGPLVIHASKGYPHSCKLLGYSKVFASALGVDANLLPTGALLGVVEVVDCVPTQVIRDGISDYKAGERERPPISPEEYAFGDYSRGRYAWELRLLMRFAEPVPARGRLGLWECRGELLPEWNAREQRKE